MPRFRSRSKSRERKKRKRALGGMSRDKRALMHWAVRGTKEDYKKLRTHARKVLLGGALPGYLEPLAVDDVAHATRETMVHALHHNPVGGALVDAVAHTINSVPGAKWTWAAKAMQASLKPFRGQGITEQDETYARLVQAGYNAQGERPDKLGGYRRVGAYDSNYVSVWDNTDGHRLVVVRGTKPSKQDLVQDLHIGARGRPKNLVGDELRKIMDESGSRVVDVAGHSLGTSLILEGYTANPGMIDKVHGTFLYNPAYGAPGLYNIGSTSDYEANPNVRYFINTGDVVSIGGIGSVGPVNMVSRNPRSLNPLANHSLEQWTGNPGKEEDLEEDDKEPAMIRFDEDPSHAGEEQVVPAFHPQ